MTSNSTHNNGQKVHDVHVVMIFSLAILESVLIALLACQLLQTVNALTFALLNVNILMSIYLDVTNYIYIAVLVIAFMCITLVIPV